MRTFVGLWAVMAVVAAPLVAAAQPPAPPPSGTPIDEGYRRQFDSCDASDRFGSVQFPIKRPDGRVRWFGCKTDPSKFARFERRAAAGGAPEAIILEAKLAHDKDGSPEACNTPGMTDLCGTSLMLRPTAARPCPRVLVAQGAGPRCLPVDASAVPYVVMPGAAPPGIDGRAFRTLTGLAFGDVGMVLANGKRVPVIIADGGPAYKMGEGSTALLAALSADGRPRTMARGVTFVLFPGSGLGPDVSADTLKEEVAAKAERLYARLVGGE